MKATIFAGGKAIGKLEEVAKRAREADAVIAADGGANVAYRAGIIPDVIVGDMDSIRPEVLENFRKRGAKVKVYPREKDETDLELAILEAKNLGAKEVEILCWYGGRPDMFVANLHLLVFARDLGIKAKLWDPAAEVFLITPDSPASFEEKEAIVSLIPLGGEAKGVKIKGLKYEFEGDLPVGRPFAVSNETLPGRKGMVSVEEGILLCFVLRGSARW